MRTVAVAIFVLTYVLIASRRLRFLPIGRPSGALLGAFLMVAAGVLSPAESYKAIDYDTILLLFAMMVLTAYMDMSGAFSALSSAIWRRFGSPRALLIALVPITGVLSAFLVNDAICLVLTPLVVTLCQRRNLPMGPYLLAIATSSNIGSAATLVGNPQNMIIGSQSGIGFTPFLAMSAPAAAAGLAINAALLWIYFARKLPAAGAPDPAPEGRTSEVRSWFPTASVVIVGAGFLAGLHLGYTALGGAMILMLAGRKEPVEALRRVDWTLLVFFVSLFIVVHGLASTGLVAEAWTAAAPHLRLDDMAGVGAFTAFMTAGSNVVSNVPMVLLTGPHLSELGDVQRGWVLLAFVTTVAGNLTLLGSVANIIVAEQSKACYTLGFWEYLRFGAVSTVLVLAAGVPLIVLMT